MTKHLVPPILILIILAVILLSPKSQNEVCFKEKCIQVSLATSSHEQEKGLMFVRELGENDSMLFIFPVSSYYSFWMKNTLIPLDIIWINDTSVVDIKQAFPCQDFCPSYLPSTPSRYVLETPVNFTVKNNISIGDNVLFHIKQDL